VSKLKALGSLLLLLLPLSSAQAVVIGASDANGTLFYLGELSNGAAYYGQTFIAPGAGNGGRSVAKDLTFTITNTFLGPTQFRVLVTEVEGDTSPPSSTGIIDLNPTNVLFESSDLFFSPDYAALPNGFPPDSNLQEITVSFGGLPLDANRTYAFLIDAFVLFDGVQNATSFLAGSSSYSDGQFFFLPNPPGSDRETNFASDWISYQTPGIDLNFSMNFVPVPEPATLALFGLGLAGIGFSRRKKA